MKIKTAKIFKVLIIIALSFLIIGLCFLAYFEIKIQAYKKSLALDSQKLLLAYSKPTFYDENGNEVEFSISADTISLAKLNDYTKSAFIAIEDKAFYKHHGVNYKRMVAAGVKNLFSGKFKEGASTISQQLVKNAFLTKEKTIERKLKEIALTSKLEKAYTKDEILEIYLNTIYFGNNIFGIESASKAYWGKSASQLSLAESACLAGIINAPSRYTTEGNKDKLIARRNLVLNEMLEDKFITKAEYETAKNEDANLIYHRPSSPLSSFEEATVAEASKILNISVEELFTNKYQIYTYLNKDAQVNLYNAITNASPLNAENGAICLNNATFGIQAFAGKTKNLASVTRQPGSAIKPILVYAPAFEHGVVSLASPILDDQINYGGFKPTNSNGTVSNSYVSVQKSIEKSLNIPAVKILDYVGIDRAKLLASKMGINFSSGDTGLGIALGGLQGGTTLPQLAGAYCALATSSYQSPSLIREIKNSQGETIYFRHVNPSKVLGEDTSYLITKSLKSVAQNGTAKKLAELPFEIAAKTGTVGIGKNGKNSDAYCCSYTTDKTLVTWIGSKDNKEENLLEKSVNGASNATNASLDFWKSAYQNNLPKSFSKPEGIVEVKLDAIELENNHKLVLANEYTPEKYTILSEFSSRYTPKETSTNFIDLSAPEIDVTLDEANFTAHIKFDAKPHLTYTIYKNNQKLYEISGETGMVSVEDASIKANEQTSYFVKATLKNFASGQSVESEPSNTKTVVLQKNITNEIENENISKDITFNDNQSTKKSRKRFNLWRFLGF